MEVSCLLWTTRCIPLEKYPRKPYDKSFIDQACSVKMVGYWPHSYFVSLRISTSSWSINTQKELGQYPAMLTSHLVNNPYLLYIGLIGPKSSVNFGNQRPWRHNCRFLRSPKVTRNHVKFARFVLLPVNEEAKIKFSVRVISLFGFGQ